MHQQQVNLSKIAQDKYTTSDNQDISTSRLMAITRKVSSDIEITKARGDEDVFPCSLTSTVCQVGEVWDSTKYFQIPRSLTFFYKSIPLRNKPFHYGLLFLYSGDVKLHNHFTSSTKEKPGSLHNLPQRGLHEKCNNFCIRTPILMILGLF